MDSKPKRKSNQKKKKHIGKTIFTTILIVLLVILAAGAGTAIAIISSAPPVPTDLTTGLKESSKIYDKDNKYIETLSDAENREIVTIDEIPKNLQNAFISIEDERFDTHKGLDFRRLFGALWYDIKNRTTEQGASTITQQLVRNYQELTKAKQITRKIQEMYLALQYERRFSKEQILTAYLNQIPLGGNVYGVQAASLYYFGKDSKDLDLAESALIASLTQSPSLHDPYNSYKKDTLQSILKKLYTGEDNGNKGVIDNTEYTALSDKIDSIFSDLLADQNYENYEKSITVVVNRMKEVDPVLNIQSRRTTRLNFYNYVPKVTYRDRQVDVLDKMLELGKIDKSQYDSAYKEKLEFRSKKNNSTMKYQWFIEPAIDQIAKDFSNKYGVTENEAKQKLRTMGYNIYLTVDQNIQDKAEAVINNSKNYPKGYKDYSTNEKDPKFNQPQAAAVIIDVSTGELRAVVGGRGEHPLRSYNRATDTDIARQPGSSIKPLAVYAPAIETKIATPATVIEDSPMPQDFVDANKWDPQNYDKKFKGYLTVRDAIKDSINLVAVKLQIMVGVNTSIDFLKNKFHISTVVTNGAVNDRNTAALALGGMSNGVTPLEMAAAYSVFANGGIYSEPVFYTKVTDDKGNTILEKKPDQSRAISPQAAYLMADMLETVVQSGTGTKAKLGKMPAGGKTGTSEDHKNGWFVGITPYYAGAVWMGHDDKNVTIKGLVGGTVAPMWKEIMAEAVKGLEVKDFNKPGGITTAQVCIDSGKAPSDLCSQDQRGSRIRTEMFIEGTEPVEICDIHTSAAVDISTGKLAPESLPPERTKNKVFIIRKIKARSSLLDDPYVLPTEYSQYTPTPNTDTDPNSNEITITPSTTPTIGN